MTGPLDWTLAEAAAATHGVVDGDASTRIHSVSTDSRSVTSGALFVAIKGEHHDGHDFVATVLVRRENVVGGRSIVRDVADAELVSTTLESPLDAVIVDDRRTFHGVTPIRRAGPGSGLRDVLLLDFNRPTGSSSGPGSGS